MEKLLKVISWNITKKCNLRCTHCYLPADHTRKDLPRVPSSLDLTTQEALGVIDQIARVNPEVMLILSGGEPLLREDVFELAGYASEKGMMVVLGSNGILINNEVAVALKQKGVFGVSISLDSVNPEIHESTRSYKGSWERAVNAVTTCNSNGLSVQINTVVTKNNYEEIPELIACAQNLGAKVFSPFFLVCTGRGEDVTDITPEQYEKVLSVLLKSQKKYKDIMIRTRCAPTFRRLLYQNNPDSYLLKMDSGKCMAGTHYCRLTPEGDVTPCPYIPLPVGNVRAQSFKDIWEGSKEFSSLRKPSLKGRCKECEFQLICGGCRARAFASYNDYMEEDPWCVYAPEGQAVISPPAFRVDSPKSDKDDTYQPLWTDAAEERLKRVPFFVRSMVKSAIERYALDNGHKEITPAIMGEARRIYGMGTMAGH
ncbi:MAG: radical SAM protein [Thermodesulfovibrionia bacterium]|nr:radical SAM protein [Thermodesulfovibrionia bacterium]